MSESSSTESSSTQSARIDEGAPSGKDTLNSPESERETEELQEHSDSTTANDPDVDSDAIKVLPGTGGPDDFGDIEIDPETLK